MPIGTPVIKVTRTKFYGADIVLTGNNYDEASAACKAAVLERKGTLVHPFDDKLVIAGQGTIGLEIMAQAPDIDIIIAPVGGGGMISGLALAAKEINPNIKIIGVEPAKIPSMAKRLHGDMSIHAPVSTIADGINVSVLNHMILLNIRTVYHMFSIEFIGSTSWFFNCRDVQDIS